MVTLPLKPSRGGFLRPFRFGPFVRDFLLGKGPHGSVKIDPEIGAHQAFIFQNYKLTLMRATALDRATRTEEKKAKREKRAIEPDNIEKLAEKYLSRMPYKANGCRYHSFVVSFSNLSRLGWVEPTGREELSAFQEHYPPGQPKKYFRLTPKGKKASDAAWANPLRALYGSN
jgi:hypothetical protein